MDTRSALHNAAVRYLVARGWTQISGELGEPDEALWLDPLASSDTTPSDVSYTWLQAVTIQWVRDGRRRTRRTTLRFPAG